jgi:hypothetical protein
MVADPKTGGTAVTAAASMVTVNGEAKECKDSVRIIAGLVRTLSFCHTARRNSEDLVRVNIQIEMEVSANQAEQGVLAVIFQMILAAHATSLHWTCPSS